MSAPRPPDLTIALPVKDGAERLPRCLAQVEAFVDGWEGRCEIVAVDDGSRDATGRLLAELAARRDDVRVLTFARNRGKGAALRAAAKASSGRMLLAMDADATYGLERLPAFVEAVERGADAAIGNRRDPGTRFVLHPRDFPYIGLRHALGAAFGWLARAIVGIRLSDSQAGFKLLRGDLARALFERVETDRFAFDVELLALLQHEQCSVVELPVTYLYEHQPSTVRLARDGLRMLRHLVRIRGTLRRLRRSGVFADHERPDYQKLAREAGNPVQRFWHRQKLGLVARQLGDVRGERVLDLGSGSSEIAARLAEQGALAFAADRSVAALAAAAAEGGKRVHAVGTDIGALPFADASFDKIVLLEVIEHLPEEAIARYAPELRRVLAPGGRLLVTTPNYRSLWPVLEWGIDRFGGAAQMGGRQHICRFHPRRLREMLHASQFRVIREGSVYHVSPFVAPLAPRLAEQLYAWELARGGRLGPILYALAEVEA